MAITDGHRAGPILFCSDGSDGSRQALAAAAELLVPRAAIVLTVWETVLMRLASSGLYTSGSYIPDEGDLDEREQAAAREAAEQSTRAAQERGWEATARVERAQDAVWKTIVKVADEIDASLDDCGARGLGPVKRAILGSVSEAVLHHGHRPTLISFQPASE